MPRNCTWDRSGSFRLASPPEDSPGDCAIARVTPEKTSTSMENNIPERLHRREGAPECKVIMDWMALTMLFWVNTNTPANRITGRKYPACKIAVAFTMKSPQARSRSRAPTADSKEPASQESLGGNYPGMSSQRLNHIEVNFIAHIKNFSQAKRAEGLRLHSFRHLEPAKV